MQYIVEDIGLLLSYGPHLKVDFLTMYFKTTQTKTSALKHVHTGHY